MSFPPNILCMARNYYLNYATVLTLCYIMPWGVPPTSSQEQIGVSNKYWSRQQLPHSKE